MPFVDEGMKYMATSVNAQFYPLAKKWIGSLKMETEIEGKYNYYDQVYDSDYNQEIIKKGNLELTQ